MRCDDGNLSYQSLLSSKMQTWMKSGSLVQRGLQLQIHSFCHSVSVKRLVFMRATFTNSLMNFCQTLTALQVRMASILHSKLFFSGWYWVPKQGQLKASTVETNSTPSSVTLVLTSFQKLLREGLSWQVLRVTAQVWWNHSSPLPVVTSLSSCALRDLMSGLLLFLMVRLPGSPRCPLTLVSVVMLSRLLLKRYMMASYPRQVDQMGKGLPLSFCLLAQLMMYMMLEVHWFSVVMGIYPPGKKTPLILLRMSSSWAWEEWQKMGMAWAPAIYRFLTQLAGKQVCLGCGCWPKSSASMVQMPMMGFCAGRAAAAERRRARRRIEGRFM